MNHRRHRQQRGFTLIEVLIALLITAVGLLGLLKIQALAISSTRESGSRGLLASQVESLTAAMQANPLYWSMMAPLDGSATLGAPPPVINIRGTATIDVAALAAATDCTGANICNPTQMAAGDLQAWARSMYAQFPTYAAVIKCGGTVPPINCGIYVTWTEHQVGINASTVNTVAAPPQSFSVYVQP